MNPALQQVNWSDEDYSAVMSARCYGSASYEYWQSVRKIPMPALSSIRRKAAMVNLEHGTLTSVFNHMKLKASTMEFRDRLCVLSFDEMHNSKQIDIDKKHEQVVRHLYILYITILIVNNAIYRLGRTNVLKWLCCEDFLGVGSRSYITITTWP